MRVYGGRSRSNTTWLLAEVHVHQQVRSVLVHGLDVVFVEKSDVGEKVVVLVLVFVEGGLGQSARVLVDCFVYVLYLGDFGLEGHPRFSGLSLFRFEQPIFPGCFLFQDSGRATELRGFGRFVVVCRVSLALMNQYVSAGVVFLQQRLLDELER